tara:strand:+ start:13950 stop:14351 length:402 start_codon:yes stop_codon:yes gene_type:complete
MSLEAEIKNLTVAITLLREHITPPHVNLKIDDEVRMETFAPIENLVTSNTIEKNLVDVMIETEVKKAEKKVAKKVAKNFSITIDEVRELAKLKILAGVKRTEVKDMITELGAESIAELNEEDLKKLNEKLKAI